MTIDNIALVRATNIIPVDGIVRPLSNTPYICKKNGSKLSYMISDWLREIKVLPSVTPKIMFSDKYDEFVANSSKILREYLPYTSDYNSFVLFSLNGICPDDNTNGFANNTFSNKKVGIIEPLSNHINNVLSLCPTDTAIIGDVELSNDAIILIEDNYYNSLKDEVKNRLNQLPLTIKVFNGTLKEAIEDELKNSNKYGCEELSLSSYSHGFIESDTSNETIECIDDITKMYNISQMKFFNLITSQDSSLPCYDIIASETKNMILIEDYYIKLFLTELLSSIGIEQKKIDRLSSLDNKTIEEELYSIINNYGIDNYKRFVDNYNKKMEDKVMDNSLQTQKEIIDMINKSKTM